jgi:dTDP-4-amino-4,6-dideoxygalactose transaminase
MPSAEVVRHVRYVDFGAQFAAERTGLMGAVEAVLARGDFIGGADVELLEAALAAYLDIEHVVALNSGTDALTFALAVLGVGRGDEVITASNSFIASAAAIAHVGAVPVFVDVLPNQLLDPAAVEAAITSRTRALMPVHLTGRVADMPALMALAQRHGLEIVEDAAQAFGSRLGGRCAGTFGRINAFSAHPLKNLNAAGDAGFVATADGVLAARVQRLRNHGFLDRDTSLEFGFVSRMDTLQAAILRYRLVNVDEVISRRRRNAELYRELLAGCAAVEIASEVPEQFNSYHLVVIQTEARDALRARLAERGIGTKVHYPVPIHLQPAADHLKYHLGSLPQTERQAALILSLPVHQFLGREDVAYVAGEIDAFFKQSSR